MQQGRKLREVKMQPCRRFAVAAVLLLCSIATASAAGTGPFLVASDDLVLTGAQEHLMWQRLVARNAASNATAPSGLIAAIGATLPAWVARPAAQTLQVCYADKEPADRKSHRPGHRRRHYRLGPGGDASDGRVGHHDLFA